MSVKIKIDNNYSQLITDDPQLITTLWKALRFRDRGYFFKRLYKQKRWDGFIDFFSQKTGKFLTGLLPEVKFALKVQGIDYVLEDLRPPFNFIHESIDDQFMNYGDHAITLYDYQVELTNSVLKHKRGIIMSPTGSGKSNCLIAICKCLPPRTPTLILANRKSLVDQNYQELVKWNVPNVGRLYDDALEPNYITCSTIQSAHKLEKVLPKIKVLLVDEIHELMSTKPVSLYRKLSGCIVRVGMSATPFKFDGKDEVQKYRCKGWIGSPLTISVAPDKKLTTKFLQDRSTLSKSICTFYPVTEPELPYEIYLDAVTLGIAESDHFNNLVTRLAATLKGRTLILVERIAHGDILHKKIPGSIWIHGEHSLEERKPVIDLLKTSKKNTVVIATVGILNTGVDFKIHSLINAAGGKADHQIAQRIGRGLRTANDKDVLRYYDFIFEINPYLKNHSEKRVKILKKLGHDVEVKDIDF